MSNYERDETLTDEVEEDADDLGDAAKRGADEAEKGAKSLTDRVTDAVEDAMEPELRRSLAPLPDRPDRDRARPPKEREDEILEDLRDRCDDG